MDSSEKYKSTIAFTDLLFNVLVGFVFLFVIAFLLINPKAKKGDIIVPAEYLIILTWNPDSADDVDLWVKDPDGQSVGFTRRDSGLMHLDRDDLGVVNDYVEINGEMTLIYLNREVVSIRGRLPGEYKVSIHLYRKHYSTKDPIQASVEVIKINPYSTVYKQSIELSVEGQIHNFYKFTIDKDGKYSSVKETDESAVPLR
jgi:hypothetical protein